MDIINKQEKLEAIISKHQDLVGKEAKNLEIEYAIGTAKKNKEAIDKIDGQNRLLQIGILGRVKAGKSSLLNALLFDGKSILPKAATPMTAALTVISYGKELSAEVEFFKHEDIENIKREAKEYEKEFEILKNQAFEELKERKSKKDEKKGLLDKVKDKAKNLLEIDKLKEQAEKRAKREIKDDMTLISSYDQWQRIKTSSVNYKDLPVFETVKSDSLEELSSKLLEYVGADGNYMPFTKSVHIKIPQDNLKGIQIVDTPGVNDPVQSREERTRELLKYCDVVFIVSPSGQFMSSEDLELMDRITTKEGIRELYVMASQADLQLFGSVKEESNGDLHQAFNNITNSLANQLYNTLSTLKESNPEIGDAYDSLIEQSRQKVIHSSGICLTIKKHFSQREKWDEGVKTAWKNLTTHYPDYFSDADEKLSIANLDLLANISTINKIVEEVKVKKNHILEARKSEFINAKAESLNKYKEGLLKFIDNQIEMINNGSIEELKAKQKKLKKIKENVSDIIDEEYYDFLDMSEININNQLISALENTFNETVNAMNKEEETETESYQKYVGRGGFLWLSKKYETRYREVKTVRTGGVETSLKKLTRSIKKHIKKEIIEVKNKWKKDLPEFLVKVLKNNIEKDDLIAKEIKEVIRNVLNTITYPDISYSQELPSTLSAQGVLKGSRAETYIADAQDYVSSLEGKLIDDINSFVDELIKGLKSFKMSKSIFGNYDEMLKELENKVQNREITLDKLNRVKNEIEKVL